MKLRITRDDILTPLQIISGVVERKQTMPVLSNILFVVTQDRVTVTGTNMEVELVCTLEGATVLSEGSITIPARKKESNKKIILDFTFLLNIYCSFVILRILNRVTR